MEEGGFKTEDGLFNVASGVFSKASFKSEPENNFFFWLSGVLIVGIVIVLDELLWTNTSLEGNKLSGSFVRQLGSLFISLLHSALGIAITLLRMEDGDLVLEQ